MARPLSTVYVDQAFTDMSDLTDASAAWKDAPSCTLKVAWNEIVARALSGVDITMDSSSLDNRVKELKVKRFGDFYFTDESGGELEQSQEAEKPKVQSIFDAFKRYIREHVLDAEINDGTGDLVSLEETEITAIKTTLTELFKMSAGADQDDITFSTELVRDSLKGISNNIVSSNEVAYAFVGQTRDAPKERALVAVIKDIIKNNGFHFTHTNGKKVYLPFVEPKIGGEDTPLADICVTYKYEGNDKYFKFKIVSGDKSDLTYDAPVDDKPDAELSLFPYVLSLVGNYADSMEDPSPDKADIKLKTQSGTELNFQFNGFDDQHSEEFWKNFKRYFGVKETSDLDRIDMKDMKNDFDRGMLLALNQRLDEISKIQTPTAAEGEESNSLTKFKGLVTLVVTAITNLSSDLQNEADMLRKYDEDGYLEQLIAELRDVEAAIVDKKAVLSAAVTDLDGEYDYTNNNYLSLGAAPSDVVAYLKGYDQLITNQRVRTPPPPST